MLGLDVITPFEVALPDGSLIQAPALLRKFGAKKGMLLFEEYSADLRAVTSVLVNTGYGFSVLGRPRESEQIDLEVIKEILADWGWSGPPDQEPSWLPDPPPENEPS